MLYQPKPRVFVGCSAESLLATVKHFDDIGLSEGRLWSNEKIRGSITEVPIMHFFISKYHELSPLFATYVTFISLL